MSLRRNPVRVWPWLIHRKLLYLLFTALENKIYPLSDIPLAVISHKMKRDLDRCFNRTDRLTLIYNAVDLDQLNPVRRQSLRSEARRKLNLDREAFAILVVGNDWRKKGLPCLLESLGKVSCASIHLLVVGRDTVEPYRQMIACLQLESQVTFLPVRSDVEFYYSAADLYVGPSLEDAFALPPLEAMACGVPAIVSSQAGVSELITDGVDGFVLENPRDSARLADLISLLHHNRSLRQKLGEAAAKTAEQYTWARNAEQLDRLFQDVLWNKALRASIFASEQPTR